MLTAGDLVWIRGAAQLPDTATLQTPSVTIDPITKIGTDGYVTTATGVPCSLIIDSRGRATPAADQRLMARLPYILCFPVGTSVQARDRALIGTRTFEIVAVEDESWNMLLPCDAVEILAHA